MKEILQAFGFETSATIHQTHARAWLIDGSYVLKKNDSQKEVERALKLNRFLRTENVLVATYLDTLSGKPYVSTEDSIYTLMRKIDGKHIDPFNGDYINIAKCLGIEVARLHKALKKFRRMHGISKCNLINDLNGWILKEIKAKNISVPLEIIESCLSFKSTYHSLPRQLIHRDIHFGNMLFDNCKLTGFLDFDISQENVRMFDIVYFFCGMLVGKYNDNVFVAKWREFVQAFLSGYHAENELLENEVAAIYHLALAIELLFVSFFSTTGQADLVSSCIDMTKWIYLNKDVFTFSMP